MSSTHRKVAARYLRDTLNIPYQTALNAIDQALGFAYPNGVPEPAQRKDANPQNVEPSIDPRWTNLGPVTPPMDYSTYRWSEFPLGVGLDGEEVVVDVSVHCHALIAGVTGSGKSTVERSFINRALVSDDWVVVGIDPKGVEFNEYRDRVSRIAIELEDTVALLRAVHNEMEARMTFRTMPTRFEPTSTNQAILLVVDEAFAVFAVEGDPQRDALHGEAANLLTMMARVGPRVGVHLVLGTQRPDAKVMSGTLRSNLDVRIVCGRLDTTPSLMVMDSDRATRVPHLKGAGVIRRGGDVTDIRFYPAPRV